MTKAKLIATLLLGLAAACTRTDAAGKKDEKPAAVTGTNVGERIPQFTTETIDVTGENPVNQAFDSHKTKAVTVYAFLGTRCPTTQMYLERMRELETAYRGQGVDFVYIYPNRGDAPDVKRDYHKAQKFAGPLIDDEGAKIAVQTLAGRKTAEMLVVDKAQTIRYRGAVDDNKEPDKVTRRHLKLALDEILADKPVSKPKTDVFA